MKLASESKKVALWNKNTLYDHIFDTRHRNMYEKRFDVKTICFADTMIVMQNK